MKLPNRKTILHTVAACVVIALLCVYFGATDGPRANPHRFEDMPGAAIFLLIAFFGSVIMMILKPIDQ